MTVLATHLVRDDAFARAGGADGRARGGAPRAHGARRSGRRRGLRRAPPLAREASRARADRQARRRRLGLPRAERPRRLGRLRGPGAVGGHRHRDRDRRGPSVRDRRERRDRQGWHVLPAHGQEAPPRAGGCRAEPPSVHLPRRLRRGVPPAPGRGVPRPRALRPDLLQPGAHVREGHRPDRGRDGLLHGRRRVRARDVGRDDHRPRHRDDLHRRPAAREGSDGRGGDRRGARRRRRAHAPLGGRRPLRHVRRARARARAADRAEPRRPAAVPVGASPHPSSPSSTRPTSTGSSRRTSATSSTRSR